MICYNQITKVIVFGENMQIEDCISFLLGKASQHVTADARVRLAPFGVTPGQYALLSVLWEQDGSSGAYLGARLQFDSATITGLLDRLERLELVERRPDPADRRVNCVYLTPKGHALQAPLTVVVAELNEQFFDQFSKKDAKRLRAALSLIGKVAITTEESPDKQAQKQQ